MSQAAHEEFFGVTKQFRKGSSTEPGEELELEFEDAEEEEVQARADNDGTDPDQDAAVNEASKGAQKRIDELTYKWREAERQRDEAFRATEVAYKKMQEKDQLLSQGEAALISNIKERAQLRLERAKELYKQAYESGDTESMISAQEELGVAQSEHREVLNYEQRRLQAAQQQQQFAPQNLPQGYPQQQYQPQPQQYQQPKPTLSSRGAKWREENPWFGSDDHQDMTALAYGLHKNLVEVKGVHPESDEYYETINAEMRRRFPEYFGEQEEDVDVGEEVEQPASQGQAQRPRPANVVAGGQRNNGSKPRKVRLTQSQAALARRLGLTPEQYARQLLQES